MNVTNPTVALMSSTSDVSETSAAYIFVSRKLELWYLFHRIDNNAFAMRKRVEVAVKGRGTRRHEIISQCLHFLFCKRCNSGRERIAATAHKAEHQIPISFWVAHDVFTNGHEVLLSSRRPIINVDVERPHFFWRFHLKMRQTRAIKRRISTRFQNRAWLMTSHGWK